MDYKHLLFSFNGRINRAKYWLFVAMALATLFGVMFIAAAVSMPLHQPGARPDFPLHYWATAVIWLALVYPGIAVAVKRLHDRNKSGWWLVLFTIVPALLQTASPFVATQSLIPGIVFSVAAIGLGLWSIAELGILEGTEGPNAFGPDPLKSVDPPAPIAS